MQHIPDKEFDKLFKDKFADAEIEPSANLWTNIEEQLTPKRKRVFPIYWMAAASIAIAITAMLLFQKTDKIQLRVDQPIVKVVKPVVDTVSSVPIVETPRVNIAPVVAKVKRNNVVESAAESKLKNIQVVMQPNKETDRLLIKEEVKPIDVLPIKEMSVESPTENPIVIAQVEPQKNIENNTISEIDSVGLAKKKFNFFAFLEKVKYKIDNVSNNIISTDKGMVSIDLGLIKINKNID